MRPRYVKATTKDIKTQNNGKMGPGEGLVELPIPGGTLRSDNPLKGIRNKISLNLNNPLKGIINLVQNGTWSQWPRRITVPT